MARRFLPIVILAGILSVSTAAWQYPAGNPVNLRVQVVDEQQRGVPYVTVELMDAVGSGSVAGRKNTDSDGNVTFRTLTGLHRFRLRGSEIEEYEGELVIEANEISHVERVLVRMKANSETAPRASAITSAARLRIPHAAAKQFDRGNKALQKGHWRDAEMAYETAISRYADYDLAYNALGVARVNLGNVSGARAAFEKAIAINRSYAAAKRNLARILLAQRDFLRADQLLRESLQVEPTNVWAMTTAASAELRLHDYAAAISNARRVHSFPHQGLEDVHYIAAIALEATGVPAEALAEYQQYLTEAPTGGNAGRARAAMARLTAQP